MTSGCQVTVYHEHLLDVFMAVAASGGIVSEDSSNYNPSTNFANFEKSFSFRLSNKFVTQFIINDPITA